MCVQNWKGGVRARQSTNRTQLHQFCHRTSANYCVKLVEGDTKGLTTNGIHLNFWISRKRNKKCQTLRTIFFLTVSDFKFVLSQFRNTSLNWSLCNIKPCGRPETPFLSPPESWRKWDPRGREERRRTVIWDLEEKKNWDEKHSD